MSKILICDDSGFARKRVKDMIQELEAEIVEASNGEEALEKIESYKPDVVILDLLMPKKDGIQVLADLAEAKNQIPVIIISADIQDATVNRCKELGAFSFINKPPKKDDVLEKLHSALNN